MNTAQFLAKQLVDHGIEQAFGVMGGASLEFAFHHRQTYGGRYLPARHENGAVSMADGFSRIADRPSLAITTKGPGLTNGLTALTSAARARTPVLLFVAGNAFWARNHFQQIDHRAMIEPTGAGYVSVPSSELAGFELGRALRMLRHERRPVVLDVAGDALGQAVPEGAAAAVGSIEPPTAYPDPAAITTIVDQLMRASRPLIVAGHGAVAADAQADLHELVGHVGALAGTSLRAPGFFDGLPSSLGLLGGLGLPGTKADLADVDCVLGFGASLNEMTCEFVPDSAQVIQIDTDPRAFGWYRRVDVAVLADVGSAVRAILAELERRRTGPRPSPVVTPRRELAAGDPPPGIADPVLVLRELERRLPVDRAIVVDVGHFMGWPIRTLTTSRPRAFVVASDFGSIGLGLGTAIGVATATQTVTCAVVGDGGLFMSLQELDTAVRARLPLLIAVINDGAYGSEVHQLRRLALPPEEATFEMPSLAETAQGLGARGAVITGVDDLDEIQDWLAAPNGPLLLDIRVGAPPEQEWHATFTGFKSKPARTGTRTI